MCLLFFIKFLFFTKNCEKCFLFHLKSSFRSQNIQIFAFSSSPLFSLLEALEPLKKKNNSLFYIIFWVISQKFDQMITMMHSGYGDTPLGLYLSKHIHMLKSYPVIILWNSYPQHSWNSRFWLFLKFFFFFFFSIFGLWIRYFGLL